MLTEFGNLRQRDDEPLRRWFQSDGEDLIVWFGGGGAILGFELCYDRMRSERALYWREGEGYSHLRVDDGEAIGKVRKSTPILLPDGVFDRQAMLARFAAISAGVPAPIVDFVRRKIEDYPGPKAET